MQLLIKALTIVIPQAAIMVMLFVWLRQEIRTLIADVAALKATMVTFFRVRIDPPQPPDNPGADQANKAA